jgi:hypothetical protein
MWGGLYYLIDCCPGCFRLIMKYPSDMDKSGSKSSKKKPRMKSRGKNEEKKLAMNDEDRKKMDEPGTVIMPRIQKEVNLDHNKKGLNVSVNL